MRQFSIRVVSLLLVACLTAERATAVAPPAEALSRPCVSHCAHSAFESQAISATLVVGAAGLLAGHRLPARLWHLMGLAAWRSAKTPSALMEETRRLAMDLKAGAGLSRAQIEEYAALRLSWLEEWPLALLVVSLVKRHSLRGWKQLLFGPRWSIPLLAFIALHSHIPAWISFSALALSWGNLSPTFRRLGPIFVNTAGLGIGWLIGNRFPGGVFGLSSTQVMIGAIVMLNTRLFQRFHSKRDAFFGALTAVFSTAVTFAAFGVYRSLLPQAPVWVVLLMSMAVGSFAHWEMDRSGFGRIWSSRQAQAMTPAERIERWHASSTVQLRQLLEAQPVLPWDRMSDEHGAVDDDFYVMDGPPSADALVRLSQWGFHCRTLAFSFPVEGGPEMETHWVVAFGPQGGGQIERPDLAHTVRFRLELNGVSMFESRPAAMQSPAPYEFSMTSYPGDPRFRFSNRLSREMLSADQASMALNIGLLRLWVEAHPLRGEISAFIEHATHPEAGFVVPHAIESTFTDEDLRHYLTWGSDEKAAEQAVRALWQVRLRDYPDNLKPDAIKNRERTQADANVTWFSNLNSSMLVSLSGWVKTRYETAQRAIETQIAGVRIPPQSIETVSLRALEVKPQAAALGRAIVAAVRPLALQTREAPQDQFTANPIPSPVLPLTHDEVALIEALRAAQQASGAGVPETLQALAEGLMATSPGSLSSLPPESQSELAQYVAAEWTSGRLTNRKNSLQTKLFARSISRGNYFFGKTAASVWNQLIAKLGLGPGPLAMIHGTPASFRLTDKFQAWQAAADVDKPRLWDEIKAIARDEVPWEDRELKPARDLAHIIRSVNRQLEFDLTTADVEVFASVMDYMVENSWKELAREFGGEHGPQFGVNDGAWGWQYDPVFLATAAGRIAIRFEPYLENLIRAYVEGWRAFDPATHATPFDSAMASVEKVFAQRHGTENEQELDKPDGLLGMLAGSHGNGHIILSIPKAAREAA